MVNSSIKHLSYKLFPANCQLCLAPTRRSLEICRHCEQDLPWLGPHCLRCALPLARQGVCGHCLKKPPHFESCTATWEYTFPIDTLISRFKYHGDRAAGALLNELAYPRMAPLNAELLVPVPMHWWRRLRRGYNQTADIAAHWSAASGIPVADILRRRKATPPQQGLSASARRKNLAGAFVLTRPEAIKGRRVALVDDVLTTGATANILAAILRRAGASHVAVCCLARTP